MKEVDLNKKVANWICTFGHAYKRISSPGRAGEPDVTGCVFGIRIEIEGKTPGEKPTKLQSQKLKFWKEAGAITGWYDSFEGAKKIVIDGLKNYATVTASYHQRKKIEELIKNGFSGDKQKT